MRSSTALFSLLATAAAAPAVRAAPIPATAAAGLQSRLVAAATLAGEAGGASAVVIDNRHYTPHGAIPPSAVLATPRPIVTTYLMGLGAEAKDAQAESEEAVVVPADADAAAVAAAKAEAYPDVAPEPDAEAESAPEAEPTLSGVNVPASLKMEAKPHHKKAKAHVSATPCYYAQLRRDYNDMMVISLVAVFLLVIVAVELWDSSEPTSETEDRLVGVIKLADDPISEKRPLSVQAFPVTRAPPALHHAVAINASPL